MNWLERAIAFVSPETAYRRAAFRSALGPYDAAGRGRLTSGWSAVNASAEVVNAGSRDLVRARAQDLERNSDIMRGIVGPLVRNVVGTGFRLQAQVTRADGSLDVELNRSIERLWTIWCRPRYCDVSKQQSFSGLLRMAVRRYAVDGGMLFVKCYTAGGPVPFCLQAREVSDLDTTLFGVSTGKNLVVGGIELDDYNAPVAYWLKTTRPDGFTTAQAERVDAQRVIFWWDRERPSQVREISRLVAALPRIRDIEGYMEAVAVKERVAACFAMVLETETPAAGGIGRSAGTTDASSGYQQETMTPGMIYRALPGQQAKAITPPNTGGGAREFVALQQRLAAAGAGMSYEAASRDLSMVNYSSIRQGALEDRSEWEIIQQDLIDVVADEVQSEWMISAMLAGELPMPGFWDDKERYLAHEFVPRGWNWVDPLKEVKADAEALDKGLDTLKRLCAERGLDWEEVLEQRGREMARMRELGISSIAAPVAPRVTK